MLSVRVQFGDSQQLRLVRILRSTVMVRVGGGWMALDEFLVKNDPCRGNVHPLLPHFMLNSTLAHGVQTGDLITLKLFVNLFVNSVLL